MHNKLTLQWLFLVLVVSLCSIASAAGLELAQAKQQGLVGEQYDGYLAAVDSSATPAVRALVSEINSKRRAEYQRIAQANNLALSDVEALAGKKAIEKTSAGDYVKLQGSSWQRK
jgi:uncharacterized protein YdbL (DUF1318 family)